MRKPCKCGSWAINDGSHGRNPGVDLHLCDVCYWHSRAHAPKEVQKLRRALEEIRAYKVKGSWGAAEVQINEIRLIAADALAKDDT